MVETKNFKSGVKWNINIELNIYTILFTTVTKILLYPILYKLTDVFDLF